MIAQLRIYSERTSKDSQSQMFFSKTQNTKHKSLHDLCFVFCVLAADKYSMKMAYDNKQLIKQKIHSLLSFLWMTNMFMGYIVKI
jgi:hypothetical protein